MLNGAARWRALWSHVVVLVCVWETGHPPQLVGATDSNLPSSQSTAHPRYLRWLREWYHCAGLMHQRASLACMLAEAKYLNRTAIIQDDYCMDRAHTRAKHAQTFINISNIYNVPEIQKEVRLLLRSGTESVEKLVQHDLSRHNYQPGKLTQSKVTSSIKTAVLESDPSLIITREFRRDYWYELCSSTPKENPEITKTRAHKSVYSKVKMIPTRLTTIAKKIVDSIGERFSYIHVRRGDKIRNSKRWPNLMHDTRGDVILKNPTVKAKIPETNAIYIATNEDDLSVFSAIFHNRKAFAMANYSQSIPEIASLSVYEANLVDLGVRDFADKGIIETFYHLTCDDKHGIASPRSCECGALMKTRCPR